MRLTATAPIATFQSTLPTRGSDRREKYIKREVMRFQSTLPTRGSDPASPVDAYCSIDIFQSTLPTRGSDFCSFLSQAPYPLISIHAPHEGERRKAQPERQWQLIFQSTLPTRGSDRYDTAVLGVHNDFNPRSPRGGATTAPPPQGSGRRYFNPRSPRGGATPVRIRLDKREAEISIHAPHEGERRYRSWMHWRTMTFQSTLPTRGSDSALVRPAAEAQVFQSTLPTRGSDSGKVHLYAAFQRIC